MLRTITFSLVFLALVVPSLPTHTVTRQRSILVVRWMGCPEPEEQPIEAAPEVFEAILVGVDRLSDPEPNRSADYRYRFEV